MGKGKKSQYATTRGGEIITSATMAVEIHTYCILYFLYDQKQKLSAMLDNKELKGGKMIRQHYRSYILSTGDIASKRQIYLSNPSCNTSTAKLKLLVSNKFNNANQICKIHTCLMGKKHTVSLYT